MDIYIVRHDIRDCEHHDVYDNYFTSLRDALDYAEFNYKSQFEYDEFVGIYQLYPEYNYLELIYSYEPPYYDPYAEYSQEDLEPEDEYWYLDPFYMEMDKVAEEDNLEAECEEWMTQNHNLPWECERMAEFVGMYNQWGYSKFGHAIYQSPSHKFRAFKWHINNDRESTRILKIFYQKLSKLYGEEFVDRFIK